MERIWTLSELNAVREKRPYTTYGGWAEQKPGFGTLGRFMPEMTHLTEDGETYELNFRFDRAAYQIMRDLGASHRVAADKAFLCPAWCGKRNAATKGQTWQFDMQVADDPDIELVAMLWPEHDIDWPDGEVNIVEGKMGRDTMLTNLHWKDPEKNEGRHAPLDVQMRPQWLNRYGLRIKPNAVLWYINGWDERGLETPHAPYRNPVHFVLQAGVNEHILERMGEDPIKDGFEWERTILFRPVMFPGIHPQFK